MFMIINVLAMGYACLQVFQFRGFGSECDDITLVGYLALANVSIYRQYMYIIGLLEILVSTCLVLLSIPVSTASLGLVCMTLSKISSNAHELIITLVHTHAHTHTHTHTYTHTHTHAHTHACTLTGSCAVRLYICICVSVSIHLRGVWLEDVCPGGLQPRDEM